MKVIIAMDSFKNSISSITSGNIIKEELMKFEECRDIEVCPFADGGEGSIDALIEEKGETVNLKVSNPVGKKIDSYYGILEDTAFIEMAKSGGLNLLGLNERNPFNTDTKGLGETIIHALDRGVRKFIIFIGGSATNDCGLGMLKALGYGFLDANGCVLEQLGNRDLEKVASIDDSRVDERISECSFKIACDVNNPLLGKNGATWIYASQKGARNEELIIHEKYQKIFSKVVFDYIKKDYSKKPGAGAAGGLGFAFLAFLGGELINGASLVMEYLHIEESIKDADLLITGEGCFDKQSLMGKGPVRLCKKAKEINPRIKTLMICGCVNNSDDLLDESIDGYFSIINMPLELNDLLKREICEKNLRTTVNQVSRLLLK